MVTGTGIETRLGSFYAIWFRENVLCGTEINKNGLILGQGENPVY